MKEQLGRKIETEGETLLCWRPSKKVSGIRCAVDSVEHLVPMVRVSQVRCKLTRVGLECEGEKKRD